MPNPLQHVCLRLMAISFKWPVTTGDVWFQNSSEEQSAHHLHTVSAVRLCLGERAYAARRSGEGPCKRCRMQKRHDRNRSISSGSIWIKVTSKCIITSFCFFWAGRSMWTSATLPGTHATWHRTEQGMEASGGTEGLRWMGMAEACSIAAAWTNFAERAWQVFCGFCDEDLIKLDC